MGTELASVRDKICAWTIRFAAAVCGALSPGPLATCLAFRRGATVEDVFIALKRRGGGGDFVRADALSADGSKRRQAKLKDPLGADTAVLKVSSNRKAAWQQQSGPA